MKGLEDDPILLPPDRGEKLRLKVVTFKMPIEDVLLLNQVAKKLGKSRSELIREVVKRWLSEMLGHT